MSVLFSKTISQTDNKTYNNVTYSSVSATFTVVTEDSTVDNKLLKVGLSISARVRCASSSGTANVPVGAIQATISTTPTYSANSYLVKLPEQAQTVGSTATQIGNGRTIFTFNRTEQPQTISVRFEMSGNGCYQQKIETFTVTVPPLKQNITAENCRITYTSGGVEYDLLNWK